MNGMIIWFTLAWICLGFKHWEERNHEVFGYSVPNHKKFAVMFFLEGPLIWICYAIMLLGIGVMSFKYWISDTSKKWLIAE